MNMGLKHSIQSFLSGLDRRHTLMAPLIWLFSISVLAAYMFSRQESCRAYASLLIAIALITAILFWLAFIVLLIRFPEKLQSEAHQIQLKALDIVERQGLAKNLKKACLENAIGKIIAPLLKDDSGR